MRSIAFVVPDISFLSGGTHLVTKWAALLSEKGFDIYLININCPRRNKLLKKSHFIKLAQYKNLEVINLKHAEKLSFDFVIATWWETFSFAKKLNSKGTGIFLQAWESQFYDYGDPKQTAFENTIREADFVIANANWLRDTLINFGYPPQNIHILIAPLDKNLWKPSTPCIRKNNDNVRFIVEGNYQEQRKNVPFALGILNDLRLEYIYVGTFVDRKLIGPTCIQVFEKAPFSKMPSIYSSCDVLVKASNAEGMFGPPLEMFATGGTAIAWDVQGAEEYMSHLYNSILVSMNDIHAFRAWISRIATDTNLVDRLKINAKRTADAVPDWHDQLPKALQIFRSLAFLEQAND